MRKFGSILAAIGGFSIIMTVARLWNDGFPRLEGPEGDTWAGVLRILAPYAVMLLISLGVLGLGGWMANRPPTREELMEKDVRVVNFYQTSLDAWKAGKLEYLHPSFKTSGERKTVSVLVEDYHPYRDIAVRTLFEKFPPAPGEFLVGVGYHWFVVTDRKLIQKDGETGEFREIALADMQAYEVRLDKKNTVICKLRSGEEIRFEDAKGYAKAEFVSKMLAEPVQG